MNGTALQSDYSEPGSLHVPSDETRAQVAALVSFGHSDKEIADYLAISVGKLKQMYATEIRTAVVDANMSVAAALRQQAEKGNVLAQMFWLKNRDPSRWKDKVTHDHQGDSGRGPVVQIHVTQAAPKELPPPLEGSAVVIRTAPKAKAIAKDG